MLDELPDAGMVGGVFSAVRASGQDVDLVPLVKAHAVAGGRLAASTLSTLTTELTERLMAAGPLDGLLLLMHGACAAEGEDDVEGHLLAASRAVVGPDLPVVVGLDHHGNLTRRMMELSTAIVGHRTQPHDVFDTGRLSGELMLRVLSSAVTPVMAWRKLRLVSHQEQYLTSQGPMKRWFGRARELERTPGVVSISNFPMQPWLDVLEAGWSTCRHRQRHCAGGATCGGVG